MREKLRGYRDAFRDPSTRSDVIRLMIVAGGCGLTTGVLELVKKFM